MNSSPIANEFWNDGTAPAFVPRRTVLPAIWKITLSPWIVVKTSAVGASPDAAPHLNCLMAIVRTVFSGPSATTYSTRACPFIATLPRSVSAVQTNRSTTTVSAPFSATNAPRSAVPCACACCVQANIPIAIAIAAASTASINARGRLSSDSSVELTESRSAVEFMLSLDDESWSPLWIILTIRKITMGMAIAAANISSVFVEPISPPRGRWPRTA